MAYQPCKPNHATNLPPRRRGGEGSWLQNLFDLDPNASWPRVASRLFTGKGNPRKALLNGKRRRTILESFQQEGTPSHKFYSSRKVHTTHITPAKQVKSTWKSQVQEPESRTEVPKPYLLTNTFAGWFSSLRTKKKSEHDHAQPPAVPNPRNPTEQRPASAGCHQHWLEAPASPGESARTSHATSIPRSLVKEFGPTNLVWHVLWCIVMAIGLLDHVSPISRRELRMDCHHTFPKSRANPSESEYPDNPAIVGREIMRRM